MSWVEVNRAPLEGQLNVHRFIADGQITALQRMRKDNRAILASIHHEYGFFGFNDLGGRFRRRTPSEQFQFSRGAALAGLQVLAPTDQERSTIIYPFLEGALTADEYLQAATEEEASMLTYKVFQDLRGAHSLGVVYGDRWSHNILVTPDHAFTHVDFDIEIYGDPAIELEVAQAAYYILSGGKEKVIPTLTQMLSNKPWFRIELVERFLRKHATWFNETKFGGIQPETEALIELVRKS